MIFLYIVYLKILCEEPTHRVLFLCPPHPLQFLMMMIIAMIMSFFGGKRFSFDFWEQHKFCARSEFLPIVQLNERSVFFHHHKPSKTFKIKAIAIIIFTVITE